MKRACKVVILAALACSFAGCASGPMYTALVSGNSLQRASDIPRIESGSKIHKPVYGSELVYKSHLSEDIRQPALFRAKYHPSCSANGWMAVKGVMKNGTEYPVVLDTGASQHFFVNDIHIRENKLAIQPFATSKVNPVGWGRCLLPQITLGDITWLNWPCLYREQHTQIRLFGLPVAEDKAVIAGLKVLMEFKYIAFDSINKEIEFSLEKSFEPTEPKLWAKYPFTIEEDFSGNALLFAEFPIGGRPTHLQLDTGSGRGLAVGQSFWDDIRDRMGKVRLTKGTDLYPYIGQLPCKHGIIKELRFGDRIIQNAHISVLPDDSPVLDLDNRGLLGMQYFADTILVIDFEHKLVWVK